jgi:hypothetical protein
MRNGAAGERLRFRHLRCILKCALDQVNETRALL